MSKLGRERRGGARIMIYFQVDMKLSLALAVTVLAPCAMCYTPQQAKGAI